jgi:hypothetical protein
VSDHDRKADDPQPSADRMARADEAERERVRAMTPSERLAEAMALSRTATRLANAPKRRA